MAELHTVYKEIMKVGTLYVWDWSSSFYSLLTKSIRAKDRVTVNRTLGMIQLSHLYSQYKVEFMTIGFVELLQISKSWSTSAEKEQQKPTLFLVLHLRTFCNPLHQ